MTLHMKRVVMPFTAIVGQERLKKALILNAINQNLHGVLIRGERGTAKSTAVRALAELLPDIEVADCPFNCDPRDSSLQCDTCHHGYSSGKGPSIIKRKMKVVELPLGATEDRILGTLDIEKALKEGIKALQPGILAEVNRGILYIDEVNLLDDHLVDILLDSAAMGVNVIEREGISLSHPSRFILVGTMNPEEGELRPQLLDRFGLSVEVRTTNEIDVRTQIIKVVEQFQEDPIAFCQRYEPQQRELRERIIKARRLLKGVTIPEGLLETIAELCSTVGVDGHRADFLITRVAKTIASFNGRHEVNEGDVKEAAELVLAHRMRRKPFEPPRPFQEDLERIFGEKKQPEEEQGKVALQQKPQETLSTGESNEGERQGDSEMVFPVGELRKVNFEIDKDRKIRVAAGRRAETLSSHRGRYVKAKVPSGDTSDIAVDATLRASIARNGKLNIEKQDIREKVRKKKTSSVIVFVVDVSGSMGAMRRMEAAKGAVMALLKEAYQKRDKVGFVAFRKDKAEVILPPTSSVELAAKRLAELPTGGKTPLPDGLCKGVEVLTREMVKNGRIVPILVLVSDGKGNVPLNGDVRQEVLDIARGIKEQGIHMVVIDSSNGLLDIGYSREIAEVSGGTYHRLDNLDSESMLRAIKPVIDESSGIPSGRKQKG